MNERMNDHSSGSVSRYAYVSFNIKYIPEEGMDLLICVMLVHIMHVHISTKVHV